MPINYLALRWVINSKRQFLDGTKIDPLHQWTGQEITTSYTNAIQYVVLGPTRLFQNYPLMPYGFVMGLIAPIVFFKLDQRFPRAGFSFWNTTVFFSSMSKFYGNLSAGFMSRLLGGTISMYWGFNYRHELWKKYNYIVAAAFDTGYDLAVLLIFLLFSFRANIEAPHWWGNNKDSVERCFALQ